MRQSRRFVAVIVSALALAAGSAYAQDKRVNVSFGAGYTAPNAEVRNHLGDGYNINFGVQVNLNRHLGIEGLYSFNGLGEKQISVSTSGTPGGPTVPTDFFGDMNMQYGTAALVWQGDVNAKSRAYVLGGGGVYYRPIKVTTPGVGYVPPFCDPWWYICYPGGFVPVDRIVGERSSTDFGMTFGGGFNITYFYTEVRYHYIWGPKVAELQPVVPANPIVPLDPDRKANGQFLQVTFGVRF
jgi:opacity protein-like surface antigen